MAAPPPTNRSGTVNASGEFSLVVTTSHGDTPAPVARFRATIHPGRHGHPTHAGRPAQHATGDRWFVAETYVTVAGRWTYLYRAVDQHGHVIDVLVSTREIS